MASLSFSLDRTSMDGEVRMKLGFSTLHIFFYFVTSFCCLAAGAIIEKNVSLAAEFALLAHLANLLQLSLWEADPKDKHREASPLVTIASTSENCKITITPPFSLQRSIFMYFVSLVPYLSTAFIIRKNLAVASALFLIGFRSSLTLAGLWLSPDQVQSRRFHILSQLTCLTLCEEAISLLEIALKESEKWDPLGGMDNETELIKEKALVFVRSEIRKREVLKTDQLDDQDWEELNSCSIYEEARKMGVEN